MDKITTEFSYATKMQWFVFHLQKVADIFQLIINEIEKADGNVPEKGGCVIS